MRLCRASESDLVVCEGRAGVQCGQQRPGQMGQVVHGQVAVDVGVEVERGVSWTLVCEELVRCGVQVPRRQSSGAQSCCTAVHAALVAHVTLARVLHLLHLNTETQNTCARILYCTILYRRANSNPIAGLLVR